MKLSISNIAWPVSHDGEMYRFLSEIGYNGVEIAPTRLFPDKPYSRITEAALFAKELRSEYGLEISSVQSLLFGRDENIFASPEQRKRLLDYLKKAVLFAEAVRCRNLVFGSPKNRNMPSAEYLPVAEAFFREIGDFAYKHGAVIAFEPIPFYYGTNLINTTPEAFAFCRKVASEGFRVNYDLGTAIFNNEKIEEVKKNIAMVHHIHISEPMLAVLKKRAVHRKIKAFDYSGYVSIEMKYFGDIETVKNTARYIAGIFA